LEFELSDLLLKQLDEHLATFAVLRGRELVSLTAQLCGVLLIIILLSMNWRQLSGSHDRLANTFALSDSL